MISIALDGPSGAGKSTVAKAIAKELGYIYVDTGAMYRTIALFTLQNGADPTDEAAVSALLPSLVLEVKYIDGAQRMFLCGEDVSDKIRTNEISMCASKVSALPAVRAFLLDLQRDMAKKNNVIMDGRDIGTVVLPNATVKIFLTASPEDRAKRRYDEFVAKGVSVSFDDVLADIIKRDHNDSTRAIAPLRPAEDSVLLDTSGNTFLQSVAQIKAIIEEKLKGI